MGMNYHVCLCVLREEYYEKDPPKLRNMNYLETIANKCLNPYYGAIFQILLEVTLDKEWFLDA